MTTLFISDLHLCEERSQINALFTHFLDNIAREAEALYILGDLFEYWIGDDQLDHDPLARHVAAQLAASAKHGTRIFFMHGNRDFLIGARFAAEASLTLLMDPTLISLNGQRVLLLHGDTLCTDDDAYQRFRTQVRDPAWQEELLAKPYAERAALARSMRSRSDVEKSMKADAIMDVNPSTVTKIFEQQDVDVVIHGHTHRPAMHVHNVFGRQLTRWVLQDWHDLGGYLADDGPEHALTAHTIATTTGT
jgi:UDP-2,3-diacylglucosamine hydrolase